MSLSPSSNVIHKAWEQSNNSDFPISSGKEWLLCYLTQDNDSRMLLPDSSSLIVLDFWTSFKITQYEIDTGQQKSLPERYHGDTSFFDHQPHLSVSSRCSIVLITYELETPPPMSDWIKLPLHNHLSLSQKTTNKLFQWYYIILFDSRTQTLKTYMLFLSHFFAHQFATYVYNNGIIIVHNVGYFMKIVIG